MDVGGVLVKYPKLFLTNRAGILLIEVSVLQRIQFLTGSAELGNSENRNTGDASPVGRDKRAFFASNKDGPISEAICSGGTSSGWVSSQSLRSEIRIIPSR